MNNCANVHLRLRTDLVDRFLDHGASLSSVDGLKALHPRSSRALLVNGGRGGQRMLVAGVAAKGGNLRVPGAGHASRPVGEDRILTQPRSQRLQSGAARRKTSNPSCNPVSLHTVLPKSM